MGVGIQYPDRLKENGFVNNIIRKADLIFAREIHPFYINRNNNVYYIPDIAFFSSKFKKTYKPFIKKYPHITFCFNKLNINDNLINLFQNELFKNKIGSLISFSKEDDLIIDKLRQIINVERTTIDYYFDSTKTAYNIIAESDLLITGRFHAGVMGIHAGIKVLNACINNEDFSFKLDYLIPEKVNYDKLLNNTNNYISNLDLKFNKFSFCYYILDKYLIEINKKRKCLGE